MADYVIRATAAEGQIRAFAATPRDLTEAVVWLRLLWDG